MPGVASKDIDSAIRFQLDTLHPYGDDEVSCGWSALPYGGVLVGIVRRATVDRYYQLFTEAGLAASSFTFSAAAVHAAIRLDGAAVNDGFVALSRSASGAVEVYGESRSRPVFSAEFDLAPERAAMLALSELRLPPDTAPLQLEAVLPGRTSIRWKTILSRNALPYATALAGACPRFAPSANVLPAEHRRLNSRTALIPTLILAGLVLLVAIGVPVYSSFADRRYLKRLEAEIARYEPAAAARRLHRSPDDRHPGKGAAPRPVPQPDPPRPRRPQRTHQARRASGLGEFHQPHPRERPHQRRSSAGILRCSRFWIPHPCSKARLPIPFNAASRAQAKFSRSA